LCDCGKIVAGALYPSKFRPQYLEEYKGAVHG
jgi:hypothetical protein